MLFAKRYDIERFWCPSDGVIGLDRWGFLDDPHTYDDWMGQPDSVPFQYIEDVPVLVLLGEPGTGKSQWFRDAQNRIAENIHRSGQQSMWIDLAEYDSASDVVDAVFRNGEFVRWARGAHRLHLCLDSFDECHFRVGVLPKRLLRELSRQPVERLCLRILCRTSEWPQTLEMGLRKLWNDRLRAAPAFHEGGTEIGTGSLDAPDELIQLFEMTPFRREDVIEIVQGEGIDSAAFLSEIHAKELVSFAFRPQTLAFLIKIYKASGQFPSNQVELYRQGCQELCGESNRERIDARIISNFTTEELFAVAGGIAAVTIFCSRHSILRYDAQTVEAKSGDISFREICQGFERVSGRDVPVREDILRETLNTGLFSGRPGGRMGWAHQTYAEFLAADYLHRHKVPAGQLVTLVQHPHWAEGKIPPQLAETAAWLSLMSRDFFDALMETDPETLVVGRRHSTGAGAEQDDQRKRLVGSLLKLLDERPLRGRGIYRIHRLENLGHQRLGDQLRPYISDRGKNFMVRGVAIRIAAKNEVRGLEGIISEVALDPDDDYQVRQQAVHALRIADDHVRFGLKPLVFGQGGDDPDDELKGLALIAMWPDLLTAEELFENLSVPNNVNLYGSYRVTFMDRVLFDRMKPEHLPAALGWVRRQRNNDGEHFSFKEVIDSIMGYAWNNLDDPAILEQFARAALHRLQQSEEIIPSGPQGRRESILFADDHKRHLLIESMLLLASESDESARLDAHDIGNIVHQRDVAWLADMFQREPDGKTRDILAFLIAWFFKPGDTELFETIYRLQVGHATLAEALKPLLGPIDLESPDETSMRRRYLRDEEKRKGEEALRRPPSCSQDMIVRYLEAIDGGNSRKFAALSLQMIAPEWNSSPTGLPTDLTGLRSWDKCEKATRVRITQAAEAYVEHCDPSPGEWIGTNKISWDAWAGYIAFVILMRVSARVLTALPSEIWSKWAPAIVACSSGRHDAESETLIAEAYARAPEAIAANVGSQIDYENGSNQHVFIVDRLGRCWDNRWTQAMLNNLNDTQLTPDSIDAILTAISKHDAKAALDFAKSKLKVPLPPRGHGRILALVAANVLMLNMPEVAWSVVWPAVTRSRPFGRKLMPILARKAYSDLESTFEQLTEEQLVTLYIWISKEYPITEEKQSGRVSRASNVHDIGERVLRQLQDRGTMESVQALQTLCKKLPQQAERLKWVLAAAKDHTLAKTWVPWRPEEVLAVAQNHQKRLVQNGDQLLEVVIESISRFQRSLHDELPAVRDLWDRQVKRLQGEDKDSGAWRPVDELALSNRIARHLREDLTERGVVIGREVEIRPGEKTDIHVDAVTRGTFPDRIELVKVIIEVKGCWNRGLEADMSGQLLGRYMAKNQCSHGLYLIGWFYCKSWDKNDGRSRKPRKVMADTSIERAQEMFDGQAAALSDQASKVVRVMVLDARYR